MAEHSAIEWTEASWNPWLGCSRVSPGCAHCYMFTEQTRYGNDPELVRRSKTKFADPLKWKEPKTIFTCSWSDWFHPDADQWRGEAWDIIWQTPHHTYQILTKRPERITEHLPHDWGAGYPNVWLGVSVENQRWTSRIAPLVRTPAAVHFLSCEPLLGSLDLLAVPNPNGAYLHCLSPGIGYDDKVPRIDWVIAGGESGPNARPMELAWARILRNDCAQAGVPFFLKQLGGFPDKRGGDQAQLDGLRHTEMPLRASVIGAMRTATRAKGAPEVLGSREA